MDQLQELLDRMNDSEIRELIRQQLGVRVSRRLTTKDLIAHYLGEAEGEIPEDDTMTWRRRYRTWLEENSQYFRSQLACDGQCVEGECPDVVVMLCVRNNRSRLL